VNLYRVQLWTPSAPRSLIADRHNNSNPLRPRCLVLASDSVTAAAGAEAVFADREAYDVAFAVGFLPLVHESTDGWTVA